VVFGAKDYGASALNLWHRGDVRRFCEEGNRNREGRETVKKGRESAMRKIKIE